MQFTHLRNAIEFLAVKLPDTFKTTTEPGKKLRKRTLHPFSLLSTPHN